MMRRERAVTREGDDALRTHDSLRRDVDPDVGRAICRPASERTLPSCGPPPSILGRTRGDTEDDVAVALQGDQGAPCPKAGSEEPRPVDPINDPPAARGAKPFADLLAKEAVIGTGLSHSIEQRLLRRDVRLGHRTAVDLRGRCHPGRTPQAQSHGVCNIGKRNASSRSGSKARKCPMTDRPSRRFEPGDSCPRGAGRGAATLASRDRRSGAPVTIAEPSIWTRSLRALRRRHTSRLHRRPTAAP